MLDPMHAPEGRIHTDKSPSTMLDLEGVLGLISERHAFALAGIGAGVCVYLFMKFVRYHMNKRHEARLPPGPKPLPLIGQPPRPAKGPQLDSLGETQGSLWSVSLLTLYLIPERLFHHTTCDVGPISSVSVFRSHIIIINDLDIAFDLLDKRSHIYSSRPVLTFGGVMYVFSGELQYICIYISRSVHGPFLAQVRLGTDCLVWPSTGKGIARSSQYAPVHGLEVRFVAFTRMHRRSNTVLSCSTWWILRKSLRLIFARELTETNNFLPAHFSMIILSAPQERSSLNWPTDTQSGVTQTTLWSI